MRRIAGLLICAVISLFAASSCMSHTTTVEVMDGYHNQLNKGAVGMALSYIAEDAVFTINADTIAGTNGVYSGRQEIRLWLENIVEAQAKTQVFDMQLKEQILTCLLHYSDESLNNLDLHDIELVESALVQGGYIQTYTLTLSPVTHQRIEDYFKQQNSDMKSVDPADRKFFMPRQMTS